MLSSFLIAGSTYRLGHYCSCWTAGGAANESAFFKCLFLLAIYYVHACVACVNHAMRIGKTRMRRNEKSDIFSRQVRSMATVRPGSSDKPNRLCRKTTTAIYLMPITIFWQIPPANLVSVFTYCWMREDLLISSYSAVSIR